LLDAIEFARGADGQYVLFNGAYPQRYTLQQIVDTFIEHHFPSATTIMVPKGIVLGVARLIRVLDVFNIGIHPDRVLKLVKSTDVYPAWLMEKGREYPNVIERALQKWADESKCNFT